MPRRIIRKTLLPVIALASIGLAVPAAATAATSASSATSISQQVSASDWMAIPVHPVTFINPVESGAAEAPLVGAYKLCVRSNISTCVTSEGLGNQMQIWATGYSTWNQSNGNFGVIWKNSNNYCVHGTTGNIVIASTSCGATNSASQWDATGDSPPRYINAAYGGYLGADVGSPGWGVELEPGVGAAYIGRYAS